MAECIREAGFHTELAEDPRGCLAVPNSQRAAFLGTKEGLLLGEPCSTLRGSLDGRGVGAERTHVWSMLLLLLLLLLSRFSRVRLCATP